MRRARLALVALALGGCQQVLGIPDNPHTPGDDADIYTVTVTTTGVVGARDTVMLALNNLPERVSSAAPFTFATRLADGAAYEVTSLADNCTVVDGSGTVEGAHVAGIAVTCNGLVALDEFGFSAPIEVTPRFDPAIETYVANVSLLTQRTAFAPSPLHAEAVLGEVVFDGALQTSPFGPFPLDERAYELAVTVRDATSIAPREYRALLTPTSPAQFGYGKPDSALPEARFGAAIAAAGDLVVVGAPNAGEVTVMRRTGQTWTSEATFREGPAGNRFGASVAIADAPIRIVVGAPGTSIGAAYIYTLDGATWSPPVRVDGTAADDEFGAAVAIHGSQIVIGAPGTTASRGAAYRAAPDGTLTAITSAVGLESGDRFGASVAVSAARIVVGAPGDDSSSNTANNNFYPEAGAAYAFDLGGGLLRYLKPATPDADDRFGTAVAVDDTTIVVGAPLADAGTLHEVGAAYRFDAGFLETHLAHPAPHAGDNFGRAVAIRGRVIVIGAPFENVPTVPEPIVDTGTVYLYSTADLAVWHPVTATNRGELDGFGSSLALTDECLLVGAPFEDAAAVGWNAPFDEGGRDTGAIYAVR